MKNILELNRDEKNKFINSFDMILFDCDGVLWSVIGEISGSGAAITLLRKFGKICKFISNNSMRSDEEYVNKLTKIGVSNVEKDDIIHPLKTIIKYLQNNNFTKSVFTVADNIFDLGLRKAGFNLIDFKIEKYNNIMEFSKCIDIKENVGAVIFDVDYNVNIAKMIQAQLYLKNPDCEFIVGASDKFVPLSNNLNVLGPYGFINILKETSGKEPIILGKPGTLLTKHIIETFSVNDPSRVLFIGDSIYQDIAFANISGFQSLLVLTGTTNETDLLHLQNDEEIPKFTANSLNDFLDFFKDL